MVVIGILASGAHCIGELEDDGSLSNVYILLMQQQGEGSRVACALVPPFQPFEMEKGIKKVESNFVMATLPVPQELESVYRQKVSNIIIAKPVDIAMLDKGNKKR